MILGVEASRALRPAGQRTGTERYARQLITALAQLLAALPSPPMLRLYSDVAPDAAACAACPGAEWRVIPSPRLWTHVRLSLEMWQHPPDWLFVPAHVLPLRRPPRTLVTIHDLGYLVFPDAHDARQRWYLDWSTRWNARVATHLLADSHATAHDLRTRLGVEATRITVVYPGFDPSPLPPPRRHDAAHNTAVLARYGVRPPYVLAIGTLQPRKNLVRLAAAFGQTLARWQNERPAQAAPQLVLAGKPGWLADQVLPPIERLGLGEHLRITGFAPDADLVVLLTNAAALAFVSLYEGFGFPILEAQASGVPVLTANTSSCPEVAGNGALLCDPLDVASIAQGLWRLLTEPDLTQTLRQTGAENVHRFAWSTAARQVWEIIGRHSPPIPAVP